jgi:serine/alanine racemase
MKRNKTIDLLRFILSILVVPIHADLFIDVSRPLFRCFTLGLVRVGVPFFFIVSGYYLKDRLDRGKTESIRRSMLRYLRLWILFILLDLAATGWYFYPTFPNTFAFLHKALFTGLSDAYWFMPALVVSQLILIPVFRKGRIPAAMAAGLVLYLFAVARIRRRRQGRGIPAAGM